ncbi:MAG TPA: glutaredoxin domain-containing protein [Actinomycetota bacterium]|jgi:mycoredoxin|nr:glutaredoxin domain-containing protein [Actinomycetota bacterium]
MTGTRGDPTDMSEPVTMYSTEWCGHCRRLKRQLGEAGIGYLEIDIDVERHHGDRIVAVTGGYRTVPTIEVRGKLLVNPTVEQVREAVAGG